MNTEFYVSNRERSKGRYINVLHYSIDNQGIDYEDMVNIYDIYQSQLITFCQEYDNARQKNNGIQVGEYDWKLLKKDKGVYMGYSNGSTVEIDYYNTFLYEYYDSEDIPNFVMGKCLYWGDADIIVIMLNDSGETYEEYERRADKDTMLLKKCFESFQQVYKEGPRWENS